MKKTKKPTGLTISQKIEQLCKSNYSSGPKQAFDDVIQLAYNMLSLRAVSGLVFPKTKVVANSSLFCDVDRYKNDPEAWELLQEIVVDFMQLIKNSEPFTDVIGGMYDEYLGKVLGQFFTPDKVATGGAAFILGEIQKPTEPILISDPTGCGAGSLVLAQIRNIYQKFGSEGTKHIVAITMDLDANMVRLCTLQVVMSALFHHIPLCSYQGHWGDIIKDYYPKPGKKGTLAFFWQPFTSDEEFLQDEIFAMEYVAKCVARLNEETKSITEEINA